MLFIQKTRGIRVEVNEKQLLLDNWKKVRFFVVSEPDSRGALKQVQRTADSATGAYSSHAL